MPIDVTLHYPNLLGMCKPGSAFSRGAWEREKATKKRVPDSPAPAGIAAMLTKTGGAGMRCARTANSGIPEGCSRVPLRCTRATLIDKREFQEERASPRSPGETKWNPGSGRMRSTAGSYKTFQTYPFTLSAEIHAAFLVPTLCVGMPIDVTLHNPNPLGICKPGSAFPRGAWKRVNDSLCSEYRDPERF